MVDFTNKNGEYFAWPGLNFISNWNLNFLEEIHFAQCVLKKSARLGFAFVGNSSLITPKIWATTLRNLHILPLKTKFNLSNSDNSPLFGRHFLHMFTFFLEFIVILGQVFMPFLVLKVFLRNFFLKWILIEHKWLIIGWALSCCLQNVLYRMALWGIWMFWHLLCQHFSIYR